jgi:predicted GNAT family N-acyltransferase
MSKSSCELVTGDIKLREASDVRRQVFVGEQRIPEKLVFDEHDREALHLVVKHGERVIGSARVQLLDGNQAKLERMTVSYRYRHKGIGSEMLLFFGSGVEV